jgi:hypothetical protein
LNQRSVRSESHGLISQMTRLMTTVSEMASVRLTSPRGHHGGKHEPDHHADQKAECDQRGEDETSHGYPSNEASGERLASAEHRRR